MSSLQKYIPEVPLPARARRLDDRPPRARGTSTGAVLEYCTDRTVLIGTRTVPFDLWGNEYAVFFFL